MSLYFSHLEYSAWRIILIFFCHFGAFPGSVLIHFHDIENTSHIVIKKIILLCSTKKSHIEDRFFIFETISNAVYIGSSLAFRTARECLCV